MKRRGALGALGIALAAAAATLVGAACTEAKLEPIPPPKFFKDDKLRVSGSICTRKPETLTFPLRVLFVVDSSESMRVTDPPDAVTGVTGRERAVRETWMDLVDQGEDVRIGIIRFSSEAQGRTPLDLDGDGLPDTYFAPGNDAGIGQLDAATAALGATDRTTNYVNALSETYFELRMEMLRADLESLPLSKYVVVFLSDGLPDVDDEEADANSDEAIIESVRALQELAGLFHVGDFSFHTAYISSGQGPALDKPAQELLEKMSEIGGGTYRSFPNGEELNFLFVDFSVIRRVFTLRALTAINLNMAMNADQVTALRFDPDQWCMDLQAALCNRGAECSAVPDDAPTPQMCREEAEALCLPEEPESDTADGELGEVELISEPEPNVCPPPPPRDQELQECLDQVAAVACEQLQTAEQLAPCVNVNAQLVCEGDEVPQGFLDLNENRQLDCGEPLIDSDGDGLGDLLEEYMTTNPFLADTDDDGLSDRIEFDLRTSGFDPLDPEDGGCFTANKCVDELTTGRCDCVADIDSDGVCDCVDDPTQPCMNAAGDDCVDLTGPADVPDTWCDCPDLDGDGHCDYEDRDGDRLNDCEELAFGTAQNGVDGDADGVPDLLELRFRTSAVEPDATGDLDWDQAFNATEVTSGTDPQCEDATFRSRVAYRYQLDETGLVEDSTCYDFAISNIVLASTQPNPDAEWPGNGWNRILVFAGEVAFDDPKTFAKYRVACVQPSYQEAGDFKNPPSGRMRLVEADFVEVADFDPDVHCKRP